MPSLSRFNLGVPPGVAGTDGRRASSPSGVCCCWLAGRLGDVLGPRRILLVGLALFTAASLGCGLAPNLGVLIAARFLQGIGGALASAVVLGMIVTLYPRPAEWDQAHCAEQRCRLGLNPPTPPVAARSPQPPPPTSVPPRRPPRR